MTFLDSLLTAQRTNNSLLCVGLDTDPAKLPAILRNEADPSTVFNRKIIEATKDLVCAYKLNLAFYESMGERGWAALHETLAMIPGGIVTIGDAKRGDIGNSSEMYARALAQDFKFTASTVSPYMGTDSVLPFIRNSDHGAFILALTSNPGAKDFQYLKVKGRPLYEEVVRKVVKWNTNRNCGLVVGATRPADLKRIRGLAKDLPILIPGVGAQGGNLKNAVRYGCDKHGERAIINASRSILYASGGVDFAEAARLEAVAMRDAMNEVREKYFSRL
jgi:orotidine-5'-phosphate decarboxylase